MAIYNCLCKHTLKQKHHPDMRLQGKVFRRGTYDELASAGVDFETLLGVSDDEDSAVSRQDYQNYAEVTKGMQNTTPTGKLGDSRPEAEPLLSSDNLTNDTIKEPRSLDGPVPSMESSGLTNSLQSLSTAMSDSEVRLTGYLYTYASILTVASGMVLHRTEDKLLSI